MYIKNIIHKYENFTLKIENIKLKEKGLTGLVGRNGAGKTTLMNILSGYLKASEISSIENLKDNEVLYIASEMDIYDYLTVYEFIYFSKKYSETNKKVDEIIELLDLTSKKDIIISELSQGMRKKLCLVPLFTKDYKVIILDEPFNSIDLTYIYKLKKFLIKKGKESTVLISSHILDIMADICDDIILMDNGRIEKIITQVDNIKKLEEEIFV